MLRIFLTSSQLSTVFMAVYAKKSKAAGDRDILLIDNFYKKKALIDLIHDAASHHQFDDIIDLSIQIPDQQDLKPSLKKRITRKIKTWPGVSSLYDFLLQKNRRNYTRELAGILSEKIKNTGTENTELNLLTQTALNKPLHVIFPNAKINYFEHGQGDYYYILKPEIPRGDFYCVFAEEFKRYQNFVGDRIRNVHSFISASEFSEAILTAGKSCSGVMSEFNNEKKYILFLMDASEIYHPPRHFWTDYIKRCISEVADPHNYCWILKPHPNQSNEVITLTKDYFKNSGLDFVMLDAPKFIPLSAEYIYVSLQERIECVFTTFSSAIFYLAHFYPNSSRYFLLYDFVGPYFRSAPKQYLTIYRDLSDMYTHMFNDLPLKRIK